MGEVTLATVIDAVPGGPRRVVGDTTTLVTSVTHESRSVEPGGLFCCVVGARSDGHDFAADAVDRGASALLVEHEVPLSVPQVIVADSRAAMGPVASAVWGNPSHALHVVGVTGTNGKTTVVTLLRQIVDHAGGRCGVIGTLTGARTTPEAPELAARLAAMRDAGFDTVAMEVSSHALDLHRVDGTAFAVVVYTNLGVDHLDFHGTVEAYFAAKAKLFDPRRAAVGVVNVDDVHGRLLRDASTVEVIPYSVDSLGPVRVEHGGTALRWRGHDVALPLLGRFNVSNALAAAEAAVALGIDPASVAAALAEVVAPPGRFEPVRAGQPFTVLVDYAHTPDALEAVLSAAREVAGGRRLHVVMGCGGDRDRTKRPRMGEVASRLADVTVITSDNPRGEDPDAIIASIVAGCVREPIVEPDRREAIGRALRGAQAGDVVVVAGKGHETTQTVGASVLSFDDRVEVRAALARLGWETTS